MSVYFLGSFYLPAQLKKMAHNKYLGNANDLLQKSYIKGLSQICKEKDIKLIALTSSNIPAFPKSGSSLWQGQNIDTLYDVRCFSLPFLNLPLIKHISRFFYALKALSNSSMNRDLIIVYDLDISLLLAVTLLKKKQKSLNFVCIIPDLIGFTGGPNNLLFQFYNKIQKKIFLSCSSYVNLFVYLTDAMHNYLKLENPYTVIEGIYNDDYDELLQRQKPTNSKTKKILYAGAMSVRNGVQKLLKAFYSIEDKDFELILCGDGELNREIKVAVKKDSRIHFMGNIPHHKVQELQKQADLLINPRPGFEDFTKYSFPSKTLEYFASGTPVLMFRLSGVPAEYYNHCFLFDSFEVDSMKECILDFFKIPKIEREKRGQNARLFVLKNKTAEVQLRKLFFILEKQSNE